SPFASRGRQGSRSSRRPAGASTRAASLDQLGTKGVVSDDRLTRSFPRVGIIHPTAFPIKLRAGRLRACSVASRGEPHRLVHWRSFFTLSKRKGLPHLGSRPSDRDFTFIPILFDRVKKLARSLLSQLG